jgi:hypothetical protein
VAPDEGTDADAGPPPCELPFTGVDCDVCSAGYDPVPIDVDGTPAISCAALGPVWGNTPISPFGVYSTEEFDGESVVTDNLTMLMWQGATPAEPAAIVDARSVCDASIYAGFSDWRLPYVHELTSLVNFDVTAPDSTLSATRFPGTNSTHHWTYNSVVEGVNGGWMMSFGDASLTVGLSDQTRQIRCVRPVGGILVNEARFEPAAELGVVLDTWTGLQWQEGSTLAAWTDAKAFCAELEAATFDDWRLSSVRDLHGLADFRLREPALDGAAFSDAANEVWWTRTADVNDPTQGWSVDFEFGSTALQAIGGEHRVRCVRGE